MFAIKSYKCSSSGRFQNGNMWRGILPILVIMVLQLVPEASRALDTPKGTSEKNFYMAINRPEGAPLFKWTKFIYTEVFRRLNIKLVLDYYPLKRASVQANKGEVDGEPARIFNYGEAYPNLIRVDEPVFSMTVVAYSADPAAPPLQGWESLRNTDYLVEYPHGMKICEDNLSRVIKAERLRSITASSQGLERLLAGRIDLYVDDLNSTTPILEAAESPFKAKIHIAGTMASTPLYMYVHKKHQPLVSQLSGHIKAMKKEGLIEHYRRMAFGLVPD